MPPTSTPLPKLPPRCLALLILRTQADLTQEEVAAAAGVSEDTLSDYERGRREPPMAVFEHIAEAMGYPSPAVRRVLLYAGEICGSLRRSADPKQELAAEVGRHAAAVTLLVLTRLEEEHARSEARKAWDDCLRTLTATERRQVLEAFPDLHTWALVEVLCTESERAAAHSAVKARELAGLAVHVADRVEPSLRQEAKAYAWPIMGNALRVSGKLNDADAAFARAADLAQGVIARCPLDGSRRLDLEASLRRDQRRPLEALELLERAERTPRLTPLARARLLIMKANALVVLGESGKALVALREAAPVVEAGQDLRLLWLLRFGQAVCLCLLNGAKEAEALLGSLRLLAAQIGNELDGLRLRWLAVRISAGLGRMVEAVEGLSSVRADFVELKLDCDAAVATTELAALYMEIGRTAEAKALTLQSIPIFRSEGVLPEAQNALALFCEAVERETVTLTLARRLVVFLERIQHDAAVSFEA